MPDSAEDISEVRPDPPNSFQKRTLWSAITAVSIVTIGAVAVGMLMLSGTILSYLQPVLVPLAVAGIIAYLLEPIVGWLQRRGWQHRWAMLMVYLGFILMVILLVVAVLVPTFGQAQEFYESRDSYFERVTDLSKKGMVELQEQFGTGVPAKYTQKGVDWITSEGPEIGKKIGLWAWERVRGAFGFFGYLLGLLLVPIYLFYFLREGHKISETWSDYLPLRASRFKDEVVETLKEVNGYLISFFRGQMIVSLIDGALVAIALSLFGLPYALLIGVFLAILGLIPYIGNLMVMLPALIIAVAHFGVTEWGDVKGGEVPKAGQVATVEMVKGEGKDQKTITVTKVVTEVSEDGKRAEVMVNAYNWMPNVWLYPLIVLLIFVTLQQINGLVTAPKIVGDSVGLHPLTVIFSVLFWSLLLGGLLGALLAVPLTAAIKVLFRRYIWQGRLESAMERRLSQGEPENANDPDNDTEPDPEPA